MNKRTPSNVGLAGSKAKVFEGGRDVPDSLKALRLCLGGVPLAKSGRMKEALEAFDDALGMDPTLAASWYNRGFVLSAEGRYDEALDAFDKAIHINPRSVHYWNGKAYILTWAERYEEAVDAFERAIEMAPDSYGHPWCGLGLALAGLGRWTEAMAANDRAIEIDPLFAQPWNGKAILFLTHPLLESGTGGSASSCFCRAVYLRRVHEQKFPLSGLVLLETVKRLHLPLLARQLITEVDAAGGGQPDSFATQTLTQCEVPLALLAALDGCGDTGETEKKVWSGIVNFLHGDPLRAFECLDAADSGDETNLACQYYLVLSLRERVDPVGKELAFALAQARTILGRFDDGVAVEQRYYAGMLFLMAEFDDEAVRCFLRAGNHLPSLYMLWYHYHRSGNSLAEPVLGAIMAEESRRGGRGRAGYLSFKELPEIVVGQAGWREDLMFYVHFSEIESVFLDVAGLDNLGRFPAYGELMQYRVDGRPMRGETLASQLSCWRVVGLELRP